MASEVVRTKRQVIFDEVFDDAGVAEMARRYNIRSGISTPLKSDGEVNGILVIATRQERIFSEVDQDFLDSIGGHLGMAIRNATLYEQSQLQNQSLNALLAVGKAVTSSFDLEEVLVSSLDTIIEVTSADAAEVWLPSGDRELVMRVHRGMCREAFVERTSLEVGQGLPGVAAQKRELVVVHDIGSDERFTRQKVTEAGFHTFCALPMLSQDRLVGVLTVASLSKDGMTQQWELSLLDAIGERVALAIENSYLHQRVQDVAVLQERERIAREMHDGLGQVLGYINTQTLAVKKLLSNDRIGDATTELTSMEENARSLYADVREGILGLRTSPHANGGLFPGLDEYVGRYGEMSGIDATLHVAANAEGCHIRPSIETQLMRIVQEALSNVRKHAKATSVSVGFTRCENILEIEVTDDGQGFDPAGVRSSGWPRFGLQTMRERAESVGGSFAVTSAPGQGASIVVRVPLGIKQEARG